MARFTILLATTILCQTIAAFARPQFDFGPTIFEIQPQQSTTTGTTTTDAPQEFTDCVTNCQTTSQYNPVCGTDGVSYNSHARLNCAQGCGLNVQVLHIGTCKSTAGGK